MSNSKQKNISYAIFGNIFWIVVATGLLLGSAHGFWRAVIIVYAEALLQKLSH